VTHTVRLADHAEADLLDICTYVLEHDGPSAADHVLRTLEEACRALGSLPGRGHVPPELDRIQVTNYREVSWKPYRIIHEVVGRTVNVLAILDGRRDLQTLLARRLIR
jgi:toxin ParE1/3/4